jgi:hypothetical protein
LNHVLLFHVLFLHVLYFHVLLLHVIYFLGLFFHVLFFVLFFHVFSTPVHATCQCSRIRATPVSVVRKNSLFQLPADLLSTFCLWNSAPPLSIAPRSCPSHAMMAMSATVTLRLTLGHEHLLVRKLQANAADQASGQARQVWPRKGLNLPAGHCTQVTELSTNKRHSLLPQP